MADKQSVLADFKPGDRVIGPNGFATIEKIWPDENTPICVHYDGWTCVQWGRPEQYTLATPRNVKRMCIAKIIQEIFNEEYGVDHEPQDLALETADKIMAVVEVE